MDRDELIELANGGNIEAMIHLAKGYFGESNVNGGLMWAEKAAEHDSYDGRYLVVLAKSVMMTAETELEFWDAMYRSSKIIQLHANILKEAHVCGKNRLSESALEEIDQKLREAHYHEALYFHFGKDEGKAGYQKITEILSQPESAKEEALCGVGCIQTGRFEEAFNHWEVVFNDDEYRRASKSQTEQSIYAASMLIFSNFFRDGLRNKCSVDLDAAVSILQKSIDGLENEGMKNMLIEELKRYKRKLFGGWKYV